MKKMILLMGAGVFLAFPSCDKNDDTDINGQDMNFMNEATFVNLGEIASGNVAKEKAADAAVVNFGDMMVSDHTAAHNDLRAIAERADYSLPTETDKKHKDMTEMLRTLEGRSFDSTYMYMMVKGHDEAIMLHEQQVADGDNPDVIRYAENKLVVIKHHRMMADSIARSLFPQ